MCFSHSGIRPQNSGVNGSRGPAQQCSYRDVITDRLGNLAGLPSRNPDPKPSVHLNVPRVMLTRAVQLAFISRCVFGGAGPSWRRQPGDVMNVLTGRNHELLNWAKQKMFQALWHEHLQPAAVTDFCSVLAIAATCVGPRLFFCPQYRSKFSANNIPFQVLKNP